MSSKDKLEIYEINKDISQFKDNILNKINNNDNKNKSTNNQKWFKKLRKGKSIKKLDFKNIFNMEGLGSINLAKLHRDANRPLKKIKEFDENIQFCPCCCLPGQKKGYLEELKFNENVNKFTQFGTGIPLYFSFFRFSLFILIFASFVISIPTLILSNYYTNQLKKACETIYENEKEKIFNYTECNIFIEIDGLTKNYINGSGWAMRFNAINLNNYKSLYKRNDTIINKTSVNYSFLYFLGIISLYIINLAYIILLFNINKRNDMLVTTPGDYSVMISNLHPTFTIFQKNLNKINNIIINNNENNKSILESIIRDKNFVSSKIKLNIEEVKDFGLEDLPQDKEINFLEGFNTFIKNRICVSAEGEKLNVSQINICYKIKELKLNEDKIQDKKSKIVKIKFDPKQRIINQKLHLKDNNRRYFYYLLNIYGINLCQLEKCKTTNLLNLEKEQSYLQKRLNNLLEQSKNLTKKNFTGVIFVTFQTKEEKEKFLKPYPKNFIMYLLISFCNLRYYFCPCLILKERRKRFFLKKNLVIESAPEPEEIQFENLEITSYKRYFRTLLIYLISAIIIIICFFCIGGLTIIQRKIKDKKDSYNIIGKFFVSFIITIVVFIMDEIFKNILERLTKMEKHITMTNYYLSVSIKLTVFTFITSSVLPLVSNYIYNKGDYNLLVDNMLILFVSNSFITPIMWTLNFNYFLKKILQFIIERKNNHYYTQIELNNLYELPNMNISYKYSYLAKSLLMTFLYTPIFPLGIIISLLGFILGYYLEKYNFIKMYKRPEMLNSNLCEFYSNYFIINFFMLGLGNYIFLRTKENNSIWTYFNTHIFIILIIIPYNQIFAFDFIGIKEYQLKNAKNYEDEYFNFYNDYERSNPMTKKEGMKNFIYRLKERKYINFIDEAILRSINNINLMEVYYKSKKNYNNFLIQRGFSLYNSEKGKKEYKSILKKFTKGKTLKNFIFKNIKKDEEQQQNKNEENIETTENNTDDIKTIKNINMKNALRNYFQISDKNSKNSNSILN